MANVNEFEIGFRGTIDSQTWPSIKTEIAKMSEKLPELDIKLSDNGTITAIVQKFEQLQKVVNGTVKTITNVDIEFNGVTEKFQVTETVNKVQEVKDQMRSLASEMQNLQGKINSALKAGANTTVQSIKEQLETVKAEFVSLSDTLRKMPGQTQAQAKSFSSKITSSYRGKLNDEDTIASSTALKKYNQLLQERYKYELQLVNVEQKLQAATGNSAEILEQQRSILKNRLGTISESISSTEKLITSTDDVAKKDQLAETAAQDHALAVNKLTLGFNDSSAAASTYAGVLKAQLVQGAFRVLSQALRAAYQEIVDLNDAMTSVRLVTGGTAKETAELAGEYQQLAQQLGSTTREVAEGADSWLRQGKTAEETTQLLKASMTMAKVGAIDAGEATDYLTSVMNGYKLSVEDAMHVVDALQAVDLAAATSVDEIAVALQKTSNIARTAGVSFEKLVGWVAATSEATRQAPELIGTSFKSLFSRLENVAAGKDVDEFGESVNDVETALTKYGIALRDSTGEFRNMGDVVDEVANKWDSFRKVEQDQIATAIGGTRQREILVALMENYGKATEYAAIATDSNGKAEEKMAAYTESLSAKMKSLRAAFDELIYDQDIITFIGMIIDGLRGLINILNKLNDTVIGKAVLTFVALTTAAKGLSIALGVLKNQAMISTVFTTLSTQLAGVTTAVAGATGVVGKLGAALGVVFSGAGMWIAAAAALALAIWKIGDQLHWWESAAESVDRLTKELEEGESKLDTYETKLQENVRLIHELREEMGKKDADPGIGTRIEVLESENGLLKEQIELQKQLNASKAQERELALSREIESMDEEFRRKYGAYDTKNIDEYEPEKNKIFNEQTATGLKDRIESYFRGIDQINARTNQTDEQILESLTRQNEAIDEAMADSRRYTDTLVEQFALYKELEDSGKGLTLEQKEKMEWLVSEIDIMAEIVGYQELYLSLTKEAVDEQDDGASGLTDWGKAAVELSDALEGTMSNYQSLLEAQKEYNDNQYLSIDTLQKIISMYPELSQVVSEYMMGLVSEQEVLRQLSDMYSIDEDNYIALLTSKLVNNEEFYNEAIYRDSELVNKLKEHYGVDLTNTKTYAEGRQKIELKLVEVLGDAWIGFLSMQEDAQTALISTLSQAQRALVENAKAADKALFNGFKEVTFKKISGGFNQMKKSINETTNATNKQTEAAKKQEQAYNNLLKITMNMLKQEQKSKKEALQNELDGYKKIIDARKKMLQQQKDEREYAKDIEAANKSISDLQNEIAELAFDTSREGVAKRLELEEQLKEKQSELEDTQYDHNIEKQENALDEEYDAFKEDIDRRIADIDEYLSHEGQIMAEAMRLITEHADTTFQKLLNWNMIWGTNTEQEMYDAWNYASLQAETYAATVDSIPSTSPIGTDITNNVSEGWRQATRELDQYLSKLGLAGLQRGDTYYSGKNSYQDPAQGTVGAHAPYKIFDSKGRQVGTAAFEREVKYALHMGASYFTNALGQKNVYHTGLNAGVVGNSGGNEQFVKALKGEAFITKYQQDRFMNSILPKIANDTAQSSPRDSVEIDTLLSVNVTGSVDDVAIRKMQKVSEQAIKMLNESMFKRGKTRTTSQVAI